MKTNLIKSYSRVLAVLFVFSCFVSSLTTADATCTIVDEPNGYILSCKGDSGTCKFIPLQGEPYYCEGKIASAEPILPPTPEP